MSARNHLIPLRGGASRQKDGPVVAAERRKMHAGGPEGAGPKMTNSTQTLSQRLADVRALRVLSARSVLSPDPRRTASTMARALTQVGLGRGDRLVAVLPNGPEFVSLLLACLQREITFVPLNPATPGDEVTRRCKAASATGIWDVAQGLRRLGGSGSSSSVSPRMPAVLLFTSGSEGDARPVALSDAALLHVADSHHRALGYDPGAAVIGFLPWSHAFGFTLELLMGLLYEAALWPVSTGTFPEVFSNVEADYLFAVPRMIERLSVGALSRLSGGIVGGAPVRGDVRERLQGTRLRVGYGQTECAPGVTLGEAGEWDCDDFLGRPLGCEVILRGQPGDAGGELLLRGENLAMGYATGEQFLPVVLEDGWRATGDLATRQGDGFIFQGRKDELFKLDNGQMVNPVPLELPYAGRILLIGEGRAAIQPLARDEMPPAFTLPLPHLPPKLMPEAFWTACTTVTGKISRRRAQALFYRP
jgi:long-subunit acyl-CoA synthetase (AMP-forming)